MKQNHSATKEELETIEKIKASTIVVEIDEVYVYTMDELRYILGINFDKIYICTDYKKNRLVDEATYLLNNSIYQVIQYV